MNDLFDPPKISPPFWGGCQFEKKQQHEGNGRPGHWMSATNLAAFTFQRPTTAAKKRRNFEWEKSEKT